MDEVRDAYRKLALTCHPDVKPNDREARDQFELITAAYSTLSRRLEDGGEEDLQIDLLRLGELLLKAASQIAVPLARDVAMPLANLTLQQSIPLLRSAAAQTRAAAVSVVNQENVMDAMKRAARLSQAEAVEGKIAMLQAKLKQAVDDHQLALIDLRDANTMATQASQRAEEERGSADLLELEERLGIEKATLATLKTQQATVLDNERKTFVREQAAQATYNGALARLKEFGDEQPSAAQARECGKEQAQVLEQQCNAELEAVRKQRQRVSAALVSISATLEQMSVSVADVQKQVDIARAAGTEAEQAVLAAKATVTEKEEEVSRRLGEVRKIKSRKARLIEILQELRNQKPIQFDAGRKRQRRS